MKWRPCAASGAPALTRTPPPFRGNFPPRSSPGAAAGGSGSGGGGASGGRRRGRSAGSGGCVASAARRGCAWGEEAPTHLIHWLPLEGRLGRARCTFQEFYPVQWHLGTATHRQYRRSDTKALECAPGSQDVEKQEPLVARLATQTVLARRPLLPYCARPSLFSPVDTHYWSRSK